MSKKVEVEVNLVDALSTTAQKLDTDSVVSSAKAAALRDVIEYITSNNLKVVKVEEVED